MKRRISYLAVGIVSVSAVFAVGSVWIKKPTAKMKENETIHFVKTAVAKPTNSGSKTSYPGTVRASRKANLFFRVSGPLIAVNVKPGDYVAKGDILMQIDPRDYKKNIEGIKNQLAAALAQLAALKNGDRPEDIAILEQEFESASALFEEAQQDYKRYSKLFKSKVASKATYDRSKSNYTVAVAELATVKQKLKKARSGARREDIDAATAVGRQLETQFRIAQDQLKDTGLRAPFDGLITKQLIENHEMAQAGYTVLAIHDISEIEIAIDVPENNMSNLKHFRGKKLKVSFASVPGKNFKAKLCEWNTDADSSTRTYELIFKMPQPKDCMILPGMTAEVAGDFTASNSAASAIHIPTSAVVSNTLGKSIVWVIDQSSKTHKRSVVPGKNHNNSDIIILTGLKTGEKIVAGGANFIRPGMIVKDIQPKN